MDKINITDYLSSVMKPARYIDHEINAVRKDLGNVSLKFGLAFPDTYEIGMSHLGMQILYSILNERADIACERVFAPWIDMETLLREKGAPLTTLESEIPLKDLDILGFSVQYELLYTNILNMLELGGIPLLSADRSNNDPLVIGGGPSVFNIEPMADFFDCILIGDGEQAVLDISNIVIQAKEEKKSRRELLEELTKIKGIYVPEFFDVSYNADGTIKAVTPLLEGYDRIEKSLITDLNKAPQPERPVVPSLEAVHDRLSIEIARGCTRGCRFCQAGMVTRPLRERKPERILDYMEKTLRNTGYDEVSLLSLSTGDYTSIEPLMCSTVAMLQDRRVSVSLPSLRVGTLGTNLASEIKKVRKTGFTMAPEAGSERLRRLINKGITEEDLLRGIREIFTLGWSVVKLYFMIGLPTETREDLNEIIRLGREVRRTAREAGGKKLKINMSAATFIPKPFTPFQWEPQLGLDDSSERLFYLRKEAKKSGLGLKWHDTRLSMLEGMFARGDRRLSGLLLCAFKKGCRFDGWSDVMSWARWQEAIVESGVDMDFYTTRRRDFSEILPWDHIDCGVTKEFLKTEMEQAVSLTETPDCAHARCTDCGVCDHKIVKNILHKTQTLENRRKNRTVAGVDPLRVRMVFSKTGRLRFLGHLDLVRVMTRAFARAGIVLCHSKGFNPKPKLNFATPLPVGIESTDEYMEMEIEPLGQYMPETFAQRINTVLPEGLKILSVKFIPLKVPPLSAMMQAQQYLIFLKNGPVGLDIEPQRIDAVVRDFLKQDSIEVRIERGDKVKVLDMRALVGQLSLTDDSTLSVTILKTQGSSIKPHEAVAHLLSIPASKACLLPILKTRTVL